MIIHSAHNLHSLHSVHSAAAAVMPGFEMAKNLPAMTITLTLLGLLPFVAVMVTSFVKLVVVISLLRNALGTQQTPPNLVVNGLALILSFYIMAPVITDMVDIGGKQKVNYSDFASVSTAFEKTSAPLRTFMMKHSNKKERAFFVKSAKDIWPPEMAEKAKETDLLILIPSFTVSELTSAFIIGFFIYLPFIVIDLVVSNVLLALGMMMVSPMTISTPIKLLLFVVINGWARLIHSLVLTYS